MYTYNQLYYQYKRLYPKYLKKIIFILNKLHSETHGQDYWESIIGLYLRRYIQNYLFLKNISKNFYLNQFRSKDVVFFRNYREYSDFNNFSSINKLKFFKKINSGQFKEYKIKVIIL